MKKRLLDLFHWILILIIAGVIFYFVCPKYELRLTDYKMAILNKMTGSWELYTSNGNQIILKSSEPLTDEKFEKGLQSDSCFPIGTKFTAEQFERLQQSWNEDIFDKIAREENQ